MQNIVDYCVIDVTESDSISTLVRTYAKQGWKCQGGVSTYYDQSEWEFLHYVQAMVKYEQS